MVSFDVYDTRGLIEHRRQNPLSWEAKAALLGAIFETSRCMLATMDLTYSDDVEDGSVKQKVEIGIIGIRKGLKNLVV